VVLSYFTERALRNFIFKRPFKGREILQKTDIKFTADTSGHCPIWVWDLGLIEIFLLWLEVSTNTT